MGSATSQQLLGGLEVSSPVLCVVETPVCGDECRVTLVGAQMLLWMLHPLKLLGQSCICLKGRGCFTCHTKQDFAQEFSFPQGLGFYE